MSTRLLLLLVCVAACDKGNPPKPSGTGSADELPPEVAKLHDPFRGVIIGPRGVYFQGHKTADLQTELTKAKAANPGEHLELLALPTASTGSITAAIDTVRRSGWTRFDLVTVDDRRLHMLCDMNSSEPLPPDPQRLTLSIDVRTDRVFVGLSIVNEFYEVPNLAGATIDFDKLATVVKEHRSNTAFEGSLTERRDAQLAVDPRWSTSVFLQLMSTVCDAGFNDLTLMRSESLTARAQL